MPTCIRFASIGNQRYLLTSCGPSIYALEWPLRSLDPVVTRVFPVPAQVGVNLRCFTLDSTSTALFAPLDNVVWRRSLLDFNPGACIDPSRENVEWPNYSHAAWFCCLDGSGHIILSDWHHHQVLAISTSGKLQYTIGHGRSGNREGTLNRPAGVALLPNGCLVVADCMNHRLQVFTKTGEFKQSVGQKGSEPGQFNKPSGVCVAPSARVYVVDKGNSRVQIFDGALRYQSFYEIPRGFDAWDIAVDAFGTVVLTDSGSDQLLILSPKNRRSSTST